MTTGFYVRVAADVAEDLRRNGFLPRGPDRGAGEVLQIVQVVMGAVGAGVALGADSATILVARHQIKRFVERLWSRADDGEAPVSADRRRLAVVFTDDGVTRSIALETCATPRSMPRRRRMRWMSPSGCTAVCRTPWRGCSHRAGIDPHKVVLVRPGS